MNRRILYGTIAFFLIGIRNGVVPQAFAATRTWDGGGINTNWNTEENWSDDTAPTASDTALLDGTGQTDVNISADTTALRLQTTSSFTGSIVLNGKLTVIEGIFLSGGILDLRGNGHDLINKGNWVNDGATLTAGTGTVFLAGTGSYTLKESGAFETLALNDGTIAYWKFDEGTGVTAYDSSGYRYDATINDATWSRTTPTAIDYTNPYSLSFDGSGDYVNAGTMDNFGSLMDTGPLAISMWFKTSTTDHALLGSLNTGTNTAIYLYLDFPSAGDIEWFIRGQGAYHSVIDVTPTVSFSDGAWHNIIAVKNSQGTSEMAVYLDGTAQPVTGTNDDGTSMSTVNLAYPLDIGGGNVRGSHNWSFDGLIDDVRIFNRVLSAADIAAISGGAYPTSGSGTYTLGSALDIEEALILASSTLDVSASNYGTTASGSMAGYGGVLTPQSGTVTLDGIDDSFGLSSFYTLTINSSSGATVTDPSTVTNALNINSPLDVTTSNITATTATITNASTISQGTGYIIHTATVSPTATLNIGESISITVTDSDENTDASTIETIQVTAGGETVTLTETTASSGVFAGSILTSNAAVTLNNGVIEDNDSCSFYVTTTFVDPEDSSDKPTGRSTVTNSNVSCEDRSNGNGGGGGGGGTTSKVSKGTIVGDALTRRYVVKTDTEPEIKPAEPVFAAAPVVFKDVQENTWYERAVYALARKGLVSGYKDTQGEPLGIFRPDREVSHAETLKIALRAAGKPELETPSDTHWAVPYHAFAEKLQLDSLFRPSAFDTPITRADTIALLVELSEVPHSDVENTFVDVPSDHPHVKAITLAMRLGWIQGDTDKNGDPTYTFRPDESLSRAELSVILERFMEWQENL